MKRIFVPTVGGQDWQRLLAKPDRHWKKGASAMTAAAAWESAADRLPPEVATLMDASRLPALMQLDLLAAIPEWEVELPGGQTTSHTDVLALCRNDRGLCVLAVEAKVLEPFGPTVGEKRAEASSGQKDRLDFLHQLLGVERFDDSIRYQLLHRTASAILTARTFHAATAVLLVHAFGTPPDRQQDFQRFCDAIGAEQQSPSVYTARRMNSPALYLAWCDGDPRFLDVQLPSAT